MSIESESTIEQAERKRRLQLTRVNPQAEGEESSEVPLIITMAPAAHGELKESLLSNHLMQMKCESSSESLDVEDPLHLTHVVVVDKNSALGSITKSKATRLARKSPIATEKSNQVTCPRLPDTLGPRGN
ncbi:MAG: hypothetical protein L3J39_17060 [Verrucomicrobiales bacterium]|nr:hypothetical protein [Verrucomicrobiales bacterium]